MSISDLLDIDPLKEPEIYLSEYIREITNTDKCMKSDDWIVKCNGDTLKMLLDD